MRSRLFDRVLGRPAKTLRPSTQLTDADVLVIAGKVIATMTGLGILDVSEQSSGIVWTVGTQNLGVNERVRIADATGAVFGHERDGLR